MHQSLRSPPSIWLTSCRQLSQIKFWRLLVLLSLSLLCATCDINRGMVAPQYPTESPAAIHPDSTLEHPLSKAETDALNSLRKVDPYPLYVMTYVKDYSQSNLMDNLQSHQVARRITHAQDAWGCSLLSILQDHETRLFGRNFDWRYSPALLLFYHPADGIPSVAMVDLYYFFNLDLVQRLDLLSLDERRPLLNTYLLPFDGMNARGLVVGMAAVPESRLPDDPNLEVVDSLAIIRRLLDHAVDVQAALELLAKIKPNWGDGPAIHYMISDASGRSVLVEFIEGEMAVIDKSGEWQVATNFLQGSSAQDHKGSCWRYDLLEATLGRNAGEFTIEDVMAMLAAVAQDGAGASTQWSIVYDFRYGQIEIAVDRKYATTYWFKLPIIPKQNQE